MNIHAIQTGTVVIRPNQRQGKGTGFMRLINTLSDRRWTEPLPIYVWVIEHSEGVIVIDTGETARAMMPGYFPGWHPYFKHVALQVSPEQEIGSQLQTRGIQPNDVRWVILTHLHTDHAGGLHHFPKSEILVMHRAFELATGFAGQTRGFLPHRWPSWFAPKLIDLAPQSFGVFPNSYIVTKAGDVAIVPTSGHTDAHISVILQESEVAYFFAGDTSYTQQLMLDQQIDGVAINAQEARQTLQRIYQFVQATPTVYLPTHDPKSRERLVNKSIVAPAKAPV
jgi:glyoxylase-like metal-dependent hydrolase (beta-lactamase superfamily II)